MRSLKAKHYKSTSLNNCFFPQLIFNFLKGPSFSDCIYFKKNLCLTQWHSKREREGDYVTAGSKVVPVIQSQSL